MHENIDWNRLDDEPCYVISIAAKLLGLHTQTLRYYEKAGLLQPSRSKGNLRLYSQKDLQRVVFIKRLIDDLGVNLAGVDVILRLLGQMDEMETRMVDLINEVERLGRPKLPPRRPIAL